jgi:hypothetical protein
MQLLGSYLFVHLFFLIVCRENLDLNFEQGAISLSMPAKAAIDLPYIHEAFRPDKSFLFTNFSFVRSHVKEKRYQKTHFTFLHIYKELYPH